MSRLPAERRVTILRALTEGCSLRSASRMAGASINTVTKLLIDAGRACAVFQHNAMRNLPGRRLQLDGIWGFAYAKDANIPEGVGNTPGIGSIWTWIAIDAETTLVPSWLVGLRDGEHARAFMDDLAGRLAGRVQITSDGLRAHAEAIDSASAGQVGYAVPERFTGHPGGRRPGTRRPSASGATSTASPATPTPTTFPPATSSGGT